MLNGPQTFNDALINEKSRAVFMKALGQADKLMDEPSFNPERLHALAAIADAAACGFESQDEDEI